MGRWELESRPWRRPRPPSAPRGGPRAARGPEGVYLPPGRAPMPPCFSQRASLPAPGERERVWERGGGRAVPRPRGPTFRPATPAGPTEGIMRPGAALRALPNAVSLVASPSGLGTLGGACLLAAIPLSLQERWAQATAVRPPSTS